MWNIINKLKNKGVTIILTTHYIEEAEVIADRVGIINQGELIIVENKNELIKKLGQKKLIIDLQSTIESIPKELQQYNLILSDNKKQISYIYNSKSSNTGITSLLQLMRDKGLALKDLKTEETSLENIFVNLVKGANDELVRH